MRPRLLELTAFGPYAGTVRIDFGDLGDDGLFLVHGPTGSGKTSILDGMTYALYGGVAGTRRPDRLRSDHADPRTPTAVSFEFSLRGTDYRITRTPPHQRAKKSGSGMTQQKPKATLSIARDGGWEPVAEGVEEVGHLVPDLLGVDREQFGQVVVLPQGAFAAALHANAKDRRRLLSSLFRTGRFEDYTAALAARAKRAEEQAAQQAAHLERLREHAANSWAVIAGATPATEDHAVDVAALAQGAVEATADAHAAVEAATSIEQATAEALAEARLTSERRRRLDTARATLAHLEEAADEIAGLRSRLDAAERAHPLEPLLVSARSAQAELDAAAAERTSAVQALRDRPAATAAAVHAAAEQALAAAAADPVDRAGLNAARDALHAAVVRLALAASQFEQSQSAALSAAVHLTAADEHRAAALRADARAAELAAQRDDLVRRRDAARAAAERLPALHAEHAGLQRAAEAVAELATLRERCAALTDEAVRRKGALNGALEEQRVLLERRIEGMAAELAATLREGEPCVVCGAASHPAAAQPGPDAVAPQALARAQERVDRARREADAADAADGGARAALEAALATAGGHGGDPHDVAARADAAAAAARAAEATAAALDGLDAELAEVDADVTAATADAAAASNAAVAADATAQECSQVALRLAAEVEAVAGAAGDPGPSLAAARATADAADQLVAAVQSEARLRDHAGAAAQRLDQMLAQCGFADAAQAASAALAVEQRRDLRRQLADVDRRRMAAEDIVAQEAAVDDEEPIPIDAVAEAHAAAATRLGEAQVRLGAVTAATGELVRLAAEFAGEQQRYDRSHLEAQRLRRLADICSGAGNDQRMSLERYVLAAYFEEIVEAASQRLSAMTGGRYTLHHSDARVRGGAASGLSITVQDAYTGTQREAGTLSGGETFQASLCLALAVADVVQRHAGGVHLDTLFIDEGFGALDADSLDQAMAELDALREGGRMVGVISHVPALRERITAGIEVTKTSGGSTVRVGILAQV